ncbi:hypothetical protein ACNJYD_33385 [Bradyrhizobium sp. DASA03005]|uniref:hypothetical protein n=1 Tax=Bradyrhizobium TaxID=374 RepID=UPI00155F4A45|nr:MULTISPECIES: hypothetical protein [Bradyrhizobium]UWU72971.1 hypothetical protein N2602_08225 [Bradyrhizobium sp. NC92]
MIRPTLIRTDRVNRNNIPPIGSSRGNVARAYCNLMSKDAFAKNLLPQRTAHAQYRGTLVDHATVREHGPDRARAKSSRTNTCFLHP